ncbi:MAG: TrkA C-terminal domain-containing protein [Nitriliruptoraceae bacterium]
MRHVDLIELTVTCDLAIAGRSLVEVGPPGSGRVMAVVRRDRVLVPTGQTLLLDGDGLLLPCGRQRRRDVVAEVTAWARGEPADER